MTNPTSNKPFQRVRLGCALIAWFLFVMSPCILFTLAQQGEIIISQGNLPEQQIRIWLIMEIDQRGLGLSSTSEQEIDGARCLQTNVQYLLWRGSEAPLSYCQCYTSVNDQWVPDDVTPGTCRP